jgi:hypothetical protein
MDATKFKQMGPAVADYLGLQRWVHNPTALVPNQNCGDFVRAVDLAPLAAERFALLAEVDRLRAALRDIGQWESQGDPVAKAWDQMCGQGAWAGLVGPD